MIKFNETDTTAGMLSKLMKGWEVIEQKAKRDFPKATSEELYQICKEAMSYALSKN